MDIQPYKIRNVLDVYRRHLIQGTTKMDHPDVDHAVVSEPSTRFAIGNRQVVIEKVSALVLRKVTTIDPRSDFNQEVIRQRQRINENGHPVPWNDRFTFNVIVGNQPKETRSVDIYSSLQLMRGIVESAEEIVIK